MLAVAQRVHRLPEAFVKICAQVVLGGQTLERFAFPDRAVAFDVIRDIARQDEESAVDPAAFLERFFDEGGDAVLV